jgi:hypothetical protein
VVETSEVNWVYQLVPGAVSILVVATSWWFDFVLRSKLLEYTAKSRQERAFAEEVALDWSGRISFHSAMLGAIVSGIIAGIDAGKTWVLVTLVIALLVASYFAQALLWTEPLGDFREGGFSIARRMDLLLVLANLGIMAVIALGPDDRRAQVCELVSRLWPG